MIMVIIFVVIYLHPPKPPCHHDATSAMLTLADQPCREKP